MLHMLGDVVFTEDNEKAFQYILDTTREHDKPMRAFVYGPSGSGKSTILDYCVRVPDMLSKKKVMGAHLGEIVSMFDLGEYGEPFLLEVGEADVLLIDGFDTFPTQGEHGAELAKLLVHARNMQNLDTIVFSATPYDELDTSELGDVLDPFLKFEIAPLDEDAMQFLANATIEKYNKSETQLSFTDDAVDFIANTFSKDAGEIHRVIEFLYTKAGIESGTTLDTDAVKKALEG